MRRIAIGLMVCGFALAILGGSAGVVSWTGQAEAQARWEQVKPAQAPADTLTRLSFPGQEKEFIVRDGGSRANLLLGPARMEWSSVPGQPGNSIIAGHRDTHFRMLKDLKRGDVIAVERGAKKFWYRIVDFEIVRASDNTYYRPTAAPMLTLVTCYPFYYVGPAPKRYIVRAEMLEKSS